VPAEVAIELRLAGSLPPVCGDPAELKQALANVLANAFDSIIEGPGRIAIATGVHGHGTDEPDAMWFDSPPPAERQCVFAEVSDTGCGMPPAVVRKMFDPFFTTKIRAQGLGLSVALGIVRGHSGAFRVRSEPSRGTVVRMVLPVSGS
jgi:signal transduction histidine kinase